MIKAFDDNTTEFFEERAAVREYDGGIGRNLAEHLAYDDTVEQYMDNFIKVKERTAPVLTAVQWMKDGDHPNVKAVVEDPEKNKVKYLIHCGPAGKKPVKPGNWIVRHPGRRFTVWTDGQFKRRFIETDEAATTDVDHHSA